MSEYLVFVSLNNYQRRRALYIFRGGLLLAVGCFALNWLFQFLWGWPLGAADNAVWNPVDWYGVGRSLLIGTVPLGLGMFFWAIADLRIDRMVRRGERGIARLDRMIRSWCFLLFAAAAVALCRVAYCAISAVAYGWPLGMVGTYYDQNANLADIGFSSDGNTIVAINNERSPLAWSAFCKKRVEVPHACPRSLTNARTRDVSDNILRLVTPDCQTSLEVDESIQLRNEIIVRGANGKETHRLAGHEGLVVAMAINHDGTRALTGSWDKTVRYWNLETAKELFCLRGHDDDVTCVVLSPDAATAFSGDMKGTILSWDLQNGRRRDGPVFDRKHHRVTTLAISGDGRRLLSGGESTGKSDKGNLCLWDIEIGRLQAEFQCSPLEVDHQIALSPDGRRAITLDLDKFVNLWRLLP